VSALGEPPLAISLDEALQAPLPPGWCWKSRAPLTLGSPAALGLGDLSIDFLRGRVAHRLARAKEEPVLRALGVQRRNGVRSVVDMTGGLGGDGSRMAAAGAEVLIVERHPVVFALLVDALQRAERAGSAPWADRLRLYHGDACELTFPGYEAAYLDPMYPARRKAALGARELRILAALFGAATATTQPEALLSAARAQPFRRIVMKGPRHYWPPDPAPDFVHEGRAVNFYGWLRSGNSASAPLAERGELDRSPGARGEGLGSA